MATSISILGLGNKSGKILSSRVLIGHPSSQASLDQLHPKVQRKGYKLEGCGCGHECRNWLEAERLIEAE